MGLRKSSSLVATGTSGKRGGGRVARARRAGRSRSVARMLPWAPSRSARARVNAPRPAPSSSQRGPTPSTPPRISATCRRGPRPDVPAVSGSTPARPWLPSVAVLPPDPLVGRAPPPVHVPAPVRVPASRGAPSRPGFPRCSVPPPGSASRCSSGVHFGSWDARRHAANAPSRASCTWADHPAVQGPAPTARAASSGSPNVACRLATPRCTPGDHGRGQAPIGRCRARYGRGQNPREGRDRAPGGFRPAGAHLVCISGAGTREGVPRMPIPALRAHGLIDAGRRRPPRRPAPGRWRSSNAACRHASAKDAHQAIDGRGQAPAGEASARGGEEDEDYALSPRAARNSS